MTSGYMICPKCGVAFQYAGYGDEGNSALCEWVEYPQPWHCQNCGSNITLNKEGRLEATSQAL